MPRNGSGTFTLVSGNPVVTGTTIESNWANTTLSDIATTLTDSLSRSGQGGMTAALRVADGTQGAPGVGFANETGSGFYRAGTGEVWAVVQGAQTLNLDASGVYVPADKTTTVDGAFVFNEAGADKDARFEGDTDANLLFTDASTDRVGVGTNAPSTKMTVRGATQSQEVALRWERATDGAVAGGLGYFYDSENSVAVGSVTNHPLKLIVNDTTGATLTTTGLGIGTSSPGAKLHVAGTFRQNDATSTYGYTVTTASSKTVTAALFGGGYFAWQTNASGTDQLTLDTSGNLGLGVTPSAWGSNYKGFEIVGAGAAIAANGSNAVTIGTGSYINSAGNWIYTTTGTAVGRYDLNSGLHRWFTAPSGTAGNAISFTQALTLDARGDLLVGTTVNLGATNDRLQVNQTTGSARAAYFKNITSGADTLALWNADTSANNIFAQFYTEATATARGSITYNRAGGLVAYNTTSDYRAKDIIGPVQNPGATIDALKVYEGKMKGATQSRPMLIAHEAQQHAPYAVSGFKDEVNEDGTPKFQQMDVSSLVPLLLAEIQSLRARVQALEAQP